MKKELKLIPQTYFAEIFQQNQFKFAFVKEGNTTYTQQHGLVLCRDFLLDVLFAEESKKTFKIYNFAWNPNKTRIDRDRTKLVINFPNKTYITTLKANLHLLHAFEKVNNLRPTRIITYKNSTNITVIGSAQYLRKAWALSFYTFLLKAFSISDTLENLSGTESGYVSQVTISKLNFLMQNFRELLSIKGSVCGVDTFEEGIGQNGKDLYRHNNSGFVSVLTNKTINSYSNNFESMWTKHRSSMVGHKEQT